MSKLAQDAAAFQKTLKRQDFTSWHSNAGTAGPSSPAATTPQTADSEYVPPGKKKPRPKSNVVWSQPADTGSGNNVNTQLVYAVDHLKSTPNPMRLEDIALLTGTPLLEDSLLLEKFKAHDRVLYNPKTNLYSYKHEYSFRTKPALLTEIQRATKNGGGIHVKTLKEVWKEAPAAVEELEAEGEVLVTRTVKDGQLRMVFWNEIKPTEEAGGKKVEQEFMDLWHQLKLPDDVELKRELANEGLQLTSAAQAPIRAPTTKKKGKRGGCPVERLRDFIVDFYVKGGPQNTDDDFYAFIWSLVAQQPTVIVGTVPDGITSEVWIAPQNSQKRKAKEKGEEIVQTAPPTLAIVADAKTLSLKELKAQYGDKLRIATNSDTTYAALTGTHIRFPKMSPMVYTALQIITRGRDNGVTVVELGQRSTYDQKTCFYLVKQLTDLDLVVKVRRGGVGTHFVIHKYFFDRSELWKGIREEESRATAELQAEEVAEAPDEDGEQDPAALNLNFAPIDARHLSSLTLLKGRILKLLKASKNQMHASSNMLIAIGFQHPTKTDRRFFTARMRELVEQRVVDGIKCYRLVSSDTESTQGDVAPTQADDDPDEQSGVKFNTTIHKQILTLIEESGKAGMTLTELTNCLAQFDRRTIELILTRTEKFPPPAHLIDLGIACLMESSGRERRNRYYTLASYLDLVAEEGLDQGNSGYAEIDRAQVGNFHPFTSDLFYSNVAALNAHQDSDLRMLLKGPSKASSKIRKNPLLPDGTVKKGRPRKQKEEGDGDDKPSRKRKRKQEDNEDQKRPTKKSRTDGDPGASTSENMGDGDDAVCTPKPAPKRRGRPPKKKPVDDSIGEEVAAAESQSGPPPKRRGRPPKNPPPIDGQPTEKRKRGRPRKDAGKTLVDTSSPAALVDIQMADTDEKGDENIGGEADPQSEDHSDAPLPPAKRARMTSSPIPESEPLEIDTLLPISTPSSALPSELPSPHVEAKDDLISSPLLVPETSIQIEPPSVPNDASAVVPDIEPIAPRVESRQSQPTKKPRQKMNKMNKMNVSTLRRENELFRVLELLGGIANTQTKELFDAHLSHLTTLAEASEPASAPPGTTMDRRTALAGFRSLEAKGRVKQFKTTLTSITGLVRPANIVYLPHITQEQISAFLLEQGRNTPQFPPTNFNHSIVVDADTEYGAKSGRKPRKSTAAQLLLGDDDENRMPNAQRADELFAMNDEAIREALLTERTTFGQLYGYIPAKMLRAREFHRYCLHAFTSGDPSLSIVSHADKLASFAFFYSELPLGLYCGLVACIDGNEELSQLLATDDGWNMPVKDLPANLHTLLQISRTRGRGRVLELLEILRSLGLAEPLRPAESDEVKVTCPPNADFPTAFCEQVGEWTSQLTTNAPDYWRFLTVAPIFHWAQSTSEPRFLRNMPVSSDTESAEYWDYLKIACVGSLDAPEAVVSDLPPAQSLLEKAKKSAKILCRRVSWTEGYSFTWHQSHYINQRISGLQDLPPLDGSDEQLSHVASIISAPLDVVRSFYEKALANQEVELEKANRRLQKEIKKKAMDTETRASLALKAAELLAEREARWDNLVVKVHPDPLPEEAAVRLKRVRTSYLQSSGAQVEKWAQKIAQALHDANLPIAPRFLTQRKGPQWRTKPAAADGTAYAPTISPPTVTNAPEKSIATLIATQGPPVAEKSKSKKKKPAEAGKEQEPEVNTGPRSRFHWNKDYDELLKDAYVIANSRCRTRGKIDYGIVKQVFPAVPKGTIRARVRSLKDATTTAAYLVRLEDHWHQIWVKYRGSKWLPDDDIRSSDFNVIQHIEFLRSHVDKNAIRVGFSEDDTAKNIIPATVEMLFDQFEVTETISGPPTWDFMFSGLVEDNREKRSLRQALTLRADDLAFATDDLTDEILFAEAAVKLTMGSGLESYDPVEAARLLHEIGEPIVQTATRNLLGRNVLSKAFRNPNSRPGRMLRISDLNNNAIGGSVPRDTFNDATALEDISAVDDSWREWPLVATDGDSAALIQLVSDNKVHFKVDTTQAQAARKVVDWNSKKADDDQIETSIFVRFHDIITAPLTPSPIETPNLEPITTLAEHGKTVDGLSACCKQVTEESLVDCPACVEAEWAALSHSLDVIDRDNLQLILDVVTGSGASGISKNGLVEKTGLPLETIRAGVRKLTDCKLPLLFWTGYKSLLLVASVYLRKWSILISQDPMMRVFPRRWLDMTGNKISDRWEAAARAVMGVLVFHPGITQAQLRWRLRSVYDRQEIYEMLQYLTQGGFVQLRGGSLPADDDEEKEVYVFVGEGPGHWFCCFALSHQPPTTAFYPSAVVLSLIYPTITMPTYLSIPSKAKLVWERLTFSRLTTIYALFSIAHFGVQIFLQTQAFTINANAAALLYSVALQGNATNSSFPALHGPEIRMCATIPLTLSTNECVVVYDGHPATNNRALDAGEKLSNNNVAAVVSTSTVARSSSSTLDFASTSDIPIFSSASAPIASSSSAIFPSGLPRVIKITQTITSTAPPTATPSSTIRDKRADKVFQTPQVKVFSLADDTTLVNITGLGYNHYPLVLDKSCMWALNWPVAKLDNTKREDIVFIAFQFWVLGMSIVALLNESMPHMLASLSTHVLATAWSGYQITHTASFRADFDRYITHGACNGAPSLLPTYWAARARAEYPTVAFNAVSLVISSILTWKLVKLFGWQTFKRVGASLTIKRVYHLVLLFSIVLQLGLFFMGATISLFLDQLINGWAGHLASYMTLYKVMFVITGLLLIPWIISGWYSVRREKGWGMIVFLAISIWYLAGWAVMFLSTTFRWTFETWNFFAIVSSISVAFSLFAFLLGVVCRYNYGKGLVRYLNAQQESMSGDDDFQRITSRTDEKVSFPSPSEKPVPTYSATFGPGADFRPNPQLGPRFFNSAAEPFESPSNSAGSSPIAAPLAAVTRSSTTDSYLTHTTPMPQRNSDHGSLNSYYDYSAGDSNHARRDSESHGTTAAGTGKRWVIDD
ncbi:B-block-TFIIIC domain-containing protein [Mycena indigotica]|uniref:B-block-TFIIIC domain-containing protein n=1 Tax=Mycena indigotica TaxID=2126181 RepID=A0A8H6SWH3_9AGAR|nr:B-block-TFIIIC domain-containing protein [Mycena indigotica]KAF7306563.1 B-block-TFIIIC domain-containing protein [Mycena indigotica]